MPVDPTSFEAAKATAVLHDCRAALFELRRNPRGVHWRLRWCAAVALLRAIGHVLHKDGRSDAAAPEFRKAVADWWEELKRTKPEPAIFWQFIEEDRNALLKEYRFRAAQGMARGYGIGPYGKGAYGEGLEEPTYLMKEGPFTGRDQRELVDDAIRWWEEQLDEINTAARSAVVEKKL